MLFPQKLPNNISALLSACDGKYPHKLPNCLGIFSNPIIRDIQRIAQTSMVTHNIQPDDVVIHLRCGDIFQFKVLECSGQYIPNMRSFCGVATSIL